MIANPTPLSHQKGQASVFVLAMLGVVIFSVIFLYQAGRITTEKMQLQNAADSAAFTAAALEARAMNFSAYTNRAMVANEIAIAQAVGLLSFATELQSVAEYLNIYGDLIDAASLGTATPFVVPMEAIGDAIGSVGDVLLDTVGVVAPYWIKAFYIVNEVYSITQSIYHYTSALLVIDGVDKALDGNIVGADDSVGTGTVGKVLMASHFATYLDGYNKRYSQSGTFDDGRLAATVRTARDDFSSGSGTNTRDWGITLNGGVDVYLAGFSFKMGVESKGGTEIVKKDDGFVWAAGDAAGFFVDVSLFLGPPFARISADIDSPDIPIGTGGYQAGDSKHSLSAWDVGDTTDASDPDAYGGAPDNYISWQIAKLETGSNKVADNPYGGLPAYRDIKTTEETTIDKMPFSYPSFLITLEKDYSDFKEDGPQFTDKFEIGGDGDSFNNIIAAAAKGRAYFKRPLESDLSYFKRKNDDYEEKDNLFSPFWQAKLEPTSDLDRIFIIALQQKQIWISDKDLSNLSGTQLDTIINDFESFLRLF